MAMRSFILATAGHVDHGKSSVVKALTGIDPDRLPEEKARGITIDLGFAHLELAPPADVVKSDTDLPRPDQGASQLGGAGAAGSAPDPSAGSARYHLGIVDVPRHEDFVKNMVAGVGSIDLALFVVAADDGWMPHTEEHLQILSYLGVDRAVIALTKIDLIQDERSTVEAIRDKLRNSPFADAPIVPTSIITGRGFDGLKFALAQVLAGTPPPRNIGKPRLPVDRVFTLRGIGTVVTGTLTGGTLQCGQSVAIQPSGKVARIRNIQSHNRDVDVGVPARRTALNLPDLSVWGDIRRGDVVTLAELGRPSEILDVLLEISPRANHSFKDGAHIRVHHGCANVRGKVAFLADKKLTAGE